LASLTQVNKLITLPFKSKLITTMIKEIEPPNAAPKSFEKAYAVQIFASAIFLLLSFSGALENFAFGLNLGPVFV